MAQNQAPSETNEADSDLPEQWTASYPRDLERINLVPSQVAKIVDLRMFYEPAYFEGRAPNTLSGLEKNSYTAGVVFAWSIGSQNRTRANILATFQDDFGEWKAEDFAGLNPVIRRTLCSALRDRGITIPIQRNAPNNTILAHLVQEGELPNAHRPEKEIVSSVELAIGGATQRGAEEREWVEPGNEWDFPPRWVPNQEIAASDVAAFGRVWEKDMSYTGELYDILDNKVRLLFHTCQTLHIKYSQLHAIFPHALKGRAKDWLVQAVKPGAPFSEMYYALKEHFDTESNKTLYYTEWTSLTFHSVRSAHTDKSDMEVLQLLLDKLQLCQKALGNAYHGDTQLVTATLRACNGVPELRMALANPAKSFEALASQLRSTLSVERAIKAQYLADNYMVDRQYGRRDRGDRYGDEQRTHSTSDRYSSRSRGSSRSTARSKWTNKCWICGKEGCRSTKHPVAERERARERWNGIRQFDPKFKGKSGYSAFLTEFEGQEDDEFEEGAEGSDEHEDEARLSEASADHYLTASYLADRSWMHRLGLDDPGDPRPPDKAPPERYNTIFLLDRYAEEVFQGIIPDTGASAHSTGGYNQYLALKKQLPQINLDTTRAGEVTVRFGDGAPRSSLGALQLSFPIGKATFHIMESATPFLLCLKDMDALDVIFDNTRNELRKRGPESVARSQRRKIPVVRKWGHAWFFTDPKHPTTAPPSVHHSFLTESELRRVHSRFGHPSVYRLHKTLARAGEEVNLDTLQMITKFCRYCQLHSAAPKRFKFALQKDVNFNYEIIVDVMYLMKLPVLHAVCASTSFQAARFLTNLSANETWARLKECWIDTYLGPPDVISHDAGTNFASGSFRAEARSLGIVCHEIPIEAHWSIGKIERYHAPLRRAFDIIFEEAKSTMAKETMLQAAVKAVNDTAGPDGLVPTLLVFGAYPRISRNSPPTAGQQQRGRAVEKAMDELRRMMAQRKLRDALNTRNGPDTKPTLPETLALGSSVRVYREKAGWQGPFKVLAVDNTEVTVEHKKGPAKFRSTHVKPFYEAGEQPTNTVAQGEQPQTETGQGGNTQAEERGSGEQLFLSEKERQSYDLALKLRRVGRITTPGKPFEGSARAEFEGLLATGVIQPIQRIDAPEGARTFKSRLVNEVKGQNTEPYEKSRMVVQGYNDADKRALLTQAPTIQRSSQRLILALAPSFMEMGMQLMLRDVTQAYTQSKTALARTILLELPRELRDHFPPDTVFLVKKPLYGLAEAGLHWFATYNAHYEDNLSMASSAFDPCLKITTPGAVFGIVGLQTDDTLALGAPEFISKEDTELQKAGFKAKPQNLLGPGDHGEFNGCRIEVYESALGITQKGQAAKIELVNGKSTDMKQQYVAQRARGAYIASICQPEAAFDLSVAAQAMEPDAAAISRLNQRLDWQLQNAHRGLRYERLRLPTAKLFVFVDGSFANNSDLSSQVGYVIVLGNESAQEQRTAFDVIGNIVHWSSTKCKRVTRSVLASEIYGMTGGFDIAFVINRTLQTIMEQLNIRAPELVICTDSFSLYQCLVQLGTTTEKRLMIDVMALRQSYEAREISEIRWIHGEDNPADAMTKGSPNEALERLVSTNKARVRVEGWVQRSK